MGSAYKGPGVVQLTGVGEVVVQAMEYGIGVGAPALERAISSHADAKYTKCGSTGGHVVAKRYGVWSGSNLSGFVLHWRDNQAEVCADGFRNGV